MTSAHSEERGGARARPAACLVVARALPRIPASQWRADARHCHRVSLWHMQDERELTVELERERRGTEIAPIRLAPDDLEPDTLRAVIESFVLRRAPTMACTRRRSRTRSRRC